MNDGGGEFESRKRSAVLGALAQQLASDRLLGVREVPFVLSEAAFRPVGALCVADVADKSGALVRLDRERVQGCRACSLCETRTNTVFGSGSSAARLVFVGEAPGFHEDKQGKPFVGRAGDLLTKMTDAMGLRRDDVYICNVLKCRPPNNRDPAPDEIVACSAYLLEQLSIIQPEVIVALGAPAARTLLNTSDSIGRLRGRFHDFHVSGKPTSGSPTPLMPTYHPAYLLRNPAEKRKAWADLQIVMKLLGLPTVR